MFVLLLFACYVDLMLTFGFMVCVWGALAFAFIVFYVSLWLVLFFKFCFVGLYFADVSCFECLLFGALFCGLCEDVGVVFAVLAVFAVVVIVCLLIVVIDDKFVAVYLFVGVL